MIMVQQKEIALTLFHEAWAYGLLYEVHWIGGGVNRIYGKTTEGQAENPDGYIVVWAHTPA